MRKPKFKVDHVCPKQMGMSNEKKIPSIEPIPGSLFFSLQYTTSLIQRDCGSLSKTLIKMISLFVPKSPSQ